MPPRKRAPKPPKREQVEKDVYFVGDRRDRPVQILTAIGQAGGWCTRYFPSADDCDAYLEVARAAGAIGRIVDPKLRIEEMVDESEWRTCSETVKVLGPLPPSVVDVGSL